MPCVESDIYNFLCLCPLCKGYTFSQHWMPEYSRDWNKCPSCGYMEEKSTSLNRVKSKLCPDKLDKPFVDPVTDDIIEEAVNIGIYGKNKKSKKKGKSKINPAAN